MVKATSGTLIECDPTVKELLKSLDEKWHFIIEHLDETHVFIVSEYLEKVKTELERLLDENSYVITTDEVVHGRDARFMVYIGFQHVLRQQSKALIRDFGCPNELEAVVKELWLMFVSTSDLVPMSSDIVGDVSQPTASQPKDAEADRILDALAYTAEDLEAEDPFDDLDDVEEAKPSATDEINEASTANKHKRPRRARKLPKYDPANRLLLHHSLALQYLAMIHLRLPILAADLCRWALMGRVPYYLATQTMPDSIRARFWYLQRWELEARRILSPPKVHDAVTRFTRIFAEKCNVTFMGPNRPLVLYRLGWEMLLPAPYLALALRFARCLNLLNPGTNTQDGLGSSRPLHGHGHRDTPYYIDTGMARYVPEIALSACCVVAWRLWSFGCGESDKASLRDKQRLREQRRQRIALLEAKMDAWVKAYDNISAETVRSFAEDSPRDFIQFCQEYLVEGRDGATETYNLDHPTAASSLNMATWSKQLEKESKEKRKKREEAQSLAQLFRDTDDSIEQTATKPARGGSSIMTQLAHGYRELVADLYKRQNEPDIQSIPLQHYSTTTRILTEQEIDTLAEHGHDAPYYKLVRHVASLLGVDLRVLQRVIGWLERQLGQ